ncbi:gustatory receptor 7 isoform X1 [Nasonia vitripennis]|uniref:Gustatory receptor n=1 Tax=Nasonia vitripennis TaxID=7425 RepID=A0A7M7Q2J7_NASVI|nr:gustatory receptor 7 isoform X1 [Nasonia vitripennis]
MKRTAKQSDSKFQVNFSLPPLRKASYAKNSSSGSSPSSSIQDIRPTFLIARVFGLAPYAITNSSINVSKRGILYSVPWLGFYLYALYNRLNLYTHSDLETKFRILSVTRTALAVIALLVDLVVCTFRDDRFQNALDCVRKYDLAVKYDVETNARLMRIHSWTIYSFMITYYLAIGWFTYVDEPYEGVMAAVIYVYLYLPLSIAVMKFVALITSILLRFRHLHRMLLPGFLSIMMELDSEPKRLHLRDVCWLHSCLCAAAANVNSLYSLQLMLWFANLTFNTISRINDFGQPQNSIDAFKLARDAGLVLIFVTLVFFIAGVCHVTSTQANKVGAVVFSPGSRYFRSRVVDHQDKEDKFYIGQYFALHPLHFSAASGFFQINLSLLLKVRTRRRRRRPASESSEQIFCQTGFDVGEWNVISLCAGCLLSSEISFILPENLVCTFYIVKLCC